MAAAAIVSALLLTMIAFPVGFAVHNSNTACPPLASSTYYSIVDVFTEWAASTNIQHGVQFEDINGDGLVDMMYGWDSGGT